MSEDVGSETQVTKRKSKAQLALETKQEFQRQVLETRAGRAFVWELLTLCGIYRSSYTGNETGTVYQEGRRSIGLEMLGEINAIRPHIHVQMMDEAISREKETS